MTLPSAPDPNSPSVSRRRRKVAVARADGEFPAAWTDLFSLLEPLPKPVFAFGPEGTILYANPAAERLFDASKARLRQIPRGRITFSGQVVEWEAFWARLGEAGCLSGVYFEIGRSGGDGGWTRPLDTIWQRITRGGMDFAVVFGQIGEVARTIALHQLDFLAGISRELHSPVRGVIGMATALLSTPLTQEQQEIAANIRDRVGMLDTVIDEIGDFANLRNGRMELSQTLFAPEFLLEDVGHALVPLAESRGTRLTVSTPCPAVRRRYLADTGRLGQLIRHLAGFMLGNLRGGQLTLRYRIEPRDEDASEAERVDFYVEDDSLDIDRLALTRFRFSGLILEHDQPEFVPVGAEWMADALSALQDSGLANGRGENPWSQGLGIPLALALARLMEGTVSALRRPGGGLSFRVSLPFHMAEEVRWPSLERLPLAGRRVLLVDMDRGEREALRRLFESFGLEVEEAAGAQEALMRLRLCDYLPDAVVVDYGIGRNEGPIMIRGIKEDPDLCMVPVIGMAMPGELDEFRRLPEGWIAMVLSKPLRSEAAARGVAAVVRALRRPPGGLFRKAPPKPDPVVSLPFWPEHPALTRGILLVEDHRDNRRVFLELLTGLGYGVTAARDGEDAVLCLKNRDYDWALVDMEMPRLEPLLSLLETRRIRAMDSFTRLAGMVDRTVAGPRLYPHVRLDAAFDKPLEPMALLHALGG